MRFRNTLIALIVLLIFGAYLGVNYYFSKPLEAKTVLNLKAEEIAKTKMPDLNAADLPAAIRVVEGTARSMGIDVV